MWLSVVDYPHRAAKHTDGHQSIRGASILLLTCFGMVRKMVWCGVVCMVVQQLLDHFCTHDTLFYRRFLVRICSLCQ